MDDASKRLARRDKRQETRENHSELRFGFGMNWRGWVDWFKPVFCGVSVMSQDGAWQVIGLSFLTLIHQISVFG
ncbi:MAG TPA: hypothetical protein DCM64_01490 [Gammaproteobacteria bacterium]|nr:hypothetical protein [Gammaproteobacteria bacterium]